MNQIIILLMISDIFFSTGFGLIEPILAIYIKEDLIGGTILNAGLASSLFIITKCIVQLPFSKYVDKHNDKVRWLIIGTFIVAFVPFIYIFTNDIKFIYIAQVIYGFGSGLAYPTWLGLWSTHLDKKHESFEWSLYSTLTTLGAAATAIIGAAIADFIGFNYTFILVGFLSLIGAFVLFGLEKKRVKSGRVSVHHYHKKRKYSHKRHH